MNEPVVEVNKAGDNCVDAKAVVALVVIVVATVVFWLLGR